RLAFLQECPPPLFEVGALHLHALEVELELHRVLEGGVHGVAHRSLDGAQRMGRTSCKTLGQLTDGGLEPLWLDHPVDDPEPLRVGGIERRSCVKQLPRPSASEHARKEPTLTS